MLFYIRWLIQKNRTSCMQLIAKNKCSVKSSLSISPAPLNCLLHFCLHLEVQFFNSPSQRHRMCGRLYRQSFASGILMRVSSVCVCWMCCSPNTIFHSFIFPRAYSRRHLRSHAFRILRPTSETIIKWKCVLVECLSTNVQQVVEGVAGRVEGAEVMEAQTYQNQITFSVSFTVTIINIQLCNVLCESQNAN